LSVFKRTSASLRVQNYTVYSLLQAFLNSFFDLFLTFTLTY
jgi:hypothetical protein